VRPLFVLIHSPLVGPYTWSLVAEELQRRGIDVLVPVLDPGPPVDEPYWRLHARSVARALAAAPREQPALLAAHSGAGPLLPAVRHFSERPVAGYLCVDAGIPVDGGSRLGPPDSPFARAVRPSLEAGVPYPRWDDAMLAPLVPQPERRRRLLAELRPQPLAFFAEPLPVFDGWPDAPAGYLLFSPAYADDAARAEALGWPVTRLDAGHFHMLVDPVAVIGALLDLARHSGVT